VRHAALATVVLLGLPVRGAAQPYAYVANIGSDDVSVIDTATQAVVAALPAGDDPDGVATSADGTRAYVTSFLSDSLTVIDTAANDVLGTIPVGSGPVGVAVSPDGTRVYVANRGGDSVSVVDTGVGAVVATIPVGRGPNAVAVTPDGTRAYVTNSFTRDPGEVSVIDLTTNAIRATVAVQHVPNRVAITPDGTTAYVTNFRSWNVSAIDTLADAVLATIRVGYKPTAIAVNPNGAYAYVTARHDFTPAGYLDIIDVIANRVRESVLLGTEPSAIGILRNGGTGYVSNFGTGSVTVIDLGDEETSGEITVGERPFAVAVNCTGEGCTQTPFTPKPTKTVTLTPTVTVTPTVTATPSHTATQTATATLQPGLEHVLIELLPYRMDDTTLLDVVLRSGGQTVAGFHHDVIFPSGVRVVATESGTPFCYEFETPPLGVARFEFLPPGCVFGCEGIHVELFTADPLSDAFLDEQIPYYCFLELDDFAGVGTYRLRNQNFGASGPLGEVLATRALDGILTVLPPMTPSPVRSARPTRTPMATSTPTRTPMPEVFLRVGSASGRPGERVGVTVGLDARGRQVAGVQADLVFAGGLRVPARPTGEPECAVNPAIDKPATAFSFIPAACSAEQCTAVRALVLSLTDTDPIRDGAVLYTCQLSIPATTSPSRVVLHLLETGASTPDGGAIPTGAVDGVVTVLGRGASTLQVAARGARICSGGAHDGSACAADAECPAGACVLVQGVCDAGQDDGLLCDCPGGTCAAQPVCATNPQNGTCRGGVNDGACCDRAFNCRGGAACVDTHRLCAAGPSKGMPCMSDSQCVAARCIASGRRCAAGDFDGVSCVDAGDCPRGDCLDPNAPPPSPIPTASPTPRRAAPDDDGCMVTAPTQRIPFALLLLPLFGLARRRRR
jgi:YVTN family beta-propeller protein